jgi:hypothetical protein
VRVFTCTSATASIKPCAGCERAPPLQAPWPPRSPLRTLRLPTGANDGARALLPLRRPCGSLPTTLIARQISSFFPKIIFPQILFFLRFYQLPYLEWGSFVLIVSIIPNSKVQQFSGETSKN